LKQSFGRVPQYARPNAFAHDTPFLFEGPIARTVEDAALVLTAINGHDPRDPFSAEGWQDFTPAVRRSIEGMRIGWSPNLDVYPVDPRVAAVAEEAVRALAEAGAVVEPVKLGLKRPQRELSDLWCRLIAPMNVRALEGMSAAGFDLLRAHRADFPPRYLEWLEVARRMSALDFFRDQEMRTEVYDAVQGVLNRCDLLVSPTLACLPVENADDGDTTGPAEVAGEAVDPLIGWCLTYLVNFTGHPAASIPAGMADGLPVGMQIIGRRYADADVFAASAAFERLRPWQGTYRIPAERPLGSR
jgi:amidase/aspartyl-tRNA(Asn)/glutamyl-tRNA(Gln) amidotransferase subunit A